jgi:uncharacterized protein
MSFAEIFRVLLFIGLVGTVYAASGWILLRLLFKPRAPLPFLAKLTLFAAAIGLACMAYGYFVEPYWPEVTHVHLVSKKLAPGAAPLRIVLLSDLHSDPKTRLEDRLPTLIAAQKPDLILFAGDAINSPEGLPNFQRCMAHLATIAPTFGVKGNWDWYWPEIDRFAGTGVQELKSKAILQRLKNTPIWITGVPADHLEKTRDAVVGINSADFAIFVCHFPYPDILSFREQQKIDLFCAGHVHGGQIALPFYGALLTLSRWGKQYEAGLYHVQAMNLYVSRGIGMEGGLAPRVRFCSRPEITVIDIGPADGGDHV